MGKLCGANLVIELLLFFHKTLCQEKTLFCPKRPECGAIFPQKIILDIIMPNRDNSRINYRQIHPSYLFAMVIYTALRKKGSESYRKEVAEDFL
jgi:hypothetical protein